MSGPRGFVGAAAAIALTALFFASCAPSGRAALEAPCDLVVYSSHNDDIVRVISAEFRERSGIKVRVVEGGTVEMLGRLRSESMHGASASAGVSAEGSASCDVLWGGGAESLAANVDLFEPYFSPEAAAILAANKAADGSWTGFTLLPMAIGYNSRLLSGDSAPKSWADLLSPRFKGAIAYADPSVSASSYTILRTLGSALESRGMSRAEAEAAFVRNLDGKLMPESATVFPAVASGEYLIGLYHDEGAHELMLSGSDLRIVYPSDGTSAVPDGVALVRGAPHEAAAKRFIDFVLSLDVARVMGARFHRRSARVDCPTPPGQAALSDIRLVDYDIAVAAAEQEATLARFKALRGGR
jgi:iron(III) transport system substrate-binding protein